MHSAKATEWLLLHAFDLEVLVARAGYKGLLVVEMAGLWWTAARVGVAGNEG